MSAPDPVPRRSRWWVAGIAFVAGVVVGVLAVGLLSSGNPDFSSVGRQPTPSSSAPSPGASGTVAVTGQAEVNAACLRVINAAQDVYTILAEVDDAASATDLQQLDDIVRRLEPIQPRLEQGLRDCRVQTGVAGGVGSASSPGQPPATSPGTRVPSPTSGSTR